MEPNQLGQLKVTHVQASFESPDSPILTMPFLLQATNLLLMGPLFQMTCGMS